MHTIEYREFALKDLEAIFESMYGDYPTQTFEYIDKLQKSIELLTTNPYLGVTC